MLDFHWFLPTYGDSRFIVGGGRPDRGDAPSATPEEAASSYIEDLLRQGRIAAPDEDTGAAPISDLGFKTHEIRAVDGGFELRRLLFDCGFDAD